MDVLATELPPSWLAYSNLRLKSIRGRQSHEIDVAIVTHDRLFLVDLKHWGFKPVSRQGYWYGGRKPVVSASVKLIELAQTLPEILKERLQWPRTPYIEAFCVFTHPRSDLTALTEEERPNCAKLADFVRLMTNDSRYASRFDTDRLWHRGHPLYENPYKAKLAQFFTNGELFEPAEATFGEFRPEIHASFSHPRKLYSEYFCQSTQDANHHALLRYWDFADLHATLHVEETRTAVAKREYAALGYIGAVAPGLSSDGVLESIDRDDEFTMRYWELFKLRRSMWRVLEHINRRQPSLERRITIASVLLGRVADLHRAAVAHRDLDVHSVWFEDETTKIYLSAFGSAHWPTTDTIGSLRSRLIATTSTLPEDVDSDNSGTPFSRDVFLLGVLCWTILTGTDVQRLELDDPEDVTRKLAVPLWDDSLFDAVLTLPETLRVVFSKALAMSPKDRFVNAIDMHSAFYSATRPDKDDALERQIRRFVVKKAPYIDYPVNAPVESRTEAWISGNGEHRVLVKHWPNVLATADGSQAALLFLRFAEELQSVQSSWCCSIIDYGVYQRGLFLVQRFIESPNLATFHWTSVLITQAYDFLCQLTQAIHELHSIVKAWHGDLKPANILISRREDSYYPTLIDLPDFASPNDGQLLTPAYSRPEQEDSPIARDCTALRLIIGEVFGAFPANRLNDSARRLLAAAALGVTTTGVDSTSLAPLLAAIELNKKQVRRAQRVSIPVIDTRGRSRILSDGGVFYVNWDKAQHTLRLVGMDEEVRIVFEGTPLQPQRAFLADVPPDKLARAQKRQIAKIDVDLHLATAESLGDKDLAWLFERVDIKRFLRPPTPNALATAVPERPATVATTGVSRPSATVSLPPSESVSDLWKITLEVEELALPVATVTGTPSFVQEDNIYKVPIEFDGSIPELDKSDRVLVVRDGQTIGEVDTQALTSASLAIRPTSKQVARLAPGAKLYLQNQQNRSSFERRVAAVTRVLDGFSEIPNLLEYFDPAKNAEPRQYDRRLPDAEQLSRYGLNEGQLAAFHTLWTTGPVGLLQGPPGTGKTRFIASYVHHALTRGGVKNVLILSQSHEAVNAAAEKLLDVCARLGEPLDVVRLGLLSRATSKVSPMHASTLQNEYRELFRAEQKQRLEGVAGQVGLSKAIVDSIFEVVVRLRPILRELRMTVNADGTAPTTRQRLMRERFDALVSEYLGSHQEPTDDTITLIVQEMASRMNLRSAKVINQFVNLLTLSEEWTGTLTAGERTLENFYARTRSVVCDTCVGIGKPALRLNETAFDLVIIDEAARCSPSDLAVGMQSGRRVILVGDHKQLPPMYTRSEATSIKRRLGMPVDSRVIETEFERVFRSKYGSKTSARLSIQYRMSPSIGKVVSQCFYEEELLETARGRVVPAYYSLLEAPFDREIVWLDTSRMGSDAYDSAHAASKSQINVREADIVLETVRILTQNQDFLDALCAAVGQHEAPIGVITMYADQRDHIREQLLESSLPPDIVERIKVGTVDGYQGKENEIIILSLVRNNARAIIGHTGDFRRLNVALSRAMNRLIIVGSTAMFKSSQVDQRNEAGLSKVVSLLESGECGVILDARELIAVRRTNNS